MLRRVHGLPLALLGALVVGCEAPPDPPKACFGDYDCLEGLICKPVTCPAPYTCQPPEAGDLADYSSRCVVDGRCDEARCENCISCPLDCCVACEATGLAALPPRDYLVSSFRISFPGEVKRSGLDLDGDGTIDKKLAGQISAVTSETADPNLAVDAHLHAGESLVALRVLSPSLTGDATQALVQPLLAEVLDATPLFDGHDTVAIAADASRDASLCGSLTDAWFVSQPGLAEVRFPVPYDVNAGHLVPLQVVRLRIEALITAEGIPELWIGGGISRAEIESVLLPRVAMVLTRQYNNSDGEVYAHSLDGNCVDSYEQDCYAMWDDPECAPDGVITVTEILCDVIMRQMFAPDLDLDWDGVKDALSFGFRLEAVPVTLVE